MPDAAPSEKRGPLFATSGILTGHFHLQEPFQASRSRGTRDWLAIYTVAGRGRFGPGAGTSHVRAGDLVVLKPGTPHYYGIERRLLRWQIIWAHFLPPPEWTSWLRWPEEAGGAMRLHLPPGPVRRWVETRLRDMHRFALRHHRLSRELAMNQLESALLRCAGLVLENSRQVDERIRAAQDFLAAHFNRPFSLEETARQAGLSRWRLAHLFREELDETPRGYHERLRLERARDLLVRTTQTVSEIAYGLGFESPFYFSSRFKRAFGASPKKFRTRLHTEED